MPKSAAFTLGDAHQSQMRASEPIGENRTGVDRRPSVQEGRSKVKYRRRTVELHPDMEEMLEFLQIELRMRSQTDVMQKAIQLLGFIMGADDGKQKKIYIEKENGNLRELIIL